MPGDARGRGKFGDCPQLSLISRTRRAKLGPASFLARPAGAVPAGRSHKDQRGKGFCAVGFYFSGFKGFKTHCFNILILLIKISEIFRFLPAGCFGRQNSTKAITRRQFIGITEKTRDIGPRPEGTLLA
jgi:hypothetical protein